MGVPFEKVYVMSHLPIVVVLCATEMLRQLRLEATMSLRLRVGRVVEWSGVSGLGA